MKIVLELELDSVNQILTMMAQKPYSEVFELINNITAQAASQLPPLLPEDTAALPDPTGELG
jgi:hypothetical protein